MSNGKFSLIVWDFLLGKRPPGLLYNLIMYREKHYKGFSYLSFPRADEDIQASYKMHFYLNIKEDWFGQAQVIVDQKNWHPPLSSDVASIES